MHFKGIQILGLLVGNTKGGNNFQRGGGRTWEQETMSAEEENCFLVFFAKRVETGIPFSTVGYIRNVVVSEVH